MMQARKGLGECSLGVGEDAGDARIELLKACDLDQNAALRDKA